MRRVFLWCSGPAVFSVSCRLLLDRITELETNPATNGGVPLPPPPFTAFPRNLLIDKNQKLFVANLRQAIDEIEREDPDIDPHLLSRHIGPAARKRIEAEARERQEEEAREAAKRPTTRKPRGAHPKGKELGAPLAYAPLSILNVQLPSQLLGLAARCLHRCQSHVLVLDCGSGPR